MFKNLDGVTGSLFKINGPTGNSVKSESYGLSIRDNTGTNLQRLGIGRASAATDASAYLDLQERAILIQFSFNGSSPPSPGSNTGNYGFCSTSGGSYTAGAIYLDNGVSLVLVTSYKGQMILTTTTVSGTVSLVSNGVYIAQTNSAPYSWTLKGDGAPATAGLTTNVALTVGLTNVTSSTSLAAGTTIRDVTINVTTGYSPGTTITVIVNGSSPLTIASPSQSDPLTVQLYSVEQFTNVGVSNAGPIQVQIAGGPGAGACTVSVTYVSVYLT